jgi:transcriptional regulator
MSRNAGDLLHGSLDLLVLRALVAEPMHGFALSRWIDQRTKGELGVVDSALYKSLHRLEDAGAVLAEWGASENNRRAKYYSLSARGRHLLRSETATWKRYVATITAVLEPG